MAHGSVEEKSNSKVEPLVWEGTADTADTEEGNEDSSYTKGSSLVEDDDMSTFSLSLHFVWCLLGWLLWGMVAVLLLICVASTVTCVFALSSIGGSSETPAPEIVASENSSGLPSPCPCPCSRDHRPTGELPTIGPLPPIGAGLPGLPGAPPLELPQPLMGLCVEGADCAYGPGWCTTMDTPVKPGQPMGYCHRGTCNGPTVANYPESACSNTNMARLNVTEFLHDLPKYWLRSLKDHDEFNAWMGRVILRNGLKGLEMNFDEVLLNYFDLELGEASGVWFQGCWPPQRNAVASGVARAPSGRLRVRAGGVNLVFSSYDLWLRFWRLRADIQCHAKYYTIASATHGAKAEPFPEDAVEAGGEFEVECERTRTVMCLLLHVMKRWISRRVVTALPGIVSSLVQTIDTLEVSPGCEDTKHNVFHLLPYESKECCEESFAEDPWGCLVGGQFNGKVPGVNTYVRGVQCEPSRLLPGTFTAQCRTVPGYYEEAAPGVCREAPIPWSPVDGIDPDWSRVLWAVRALAWTDVALSFALCWTLVACICCPRCCRPKCRRRSEVHCVYKHYSPA